jgi:hypothetical protein
VWALPWTVTAIVDTTGGTRPCSSLTQGLVRLTVVQTYEASLVVVSFSKGTTQSGPIITKIRAELAIPVQLQSNSGGWLHRVFPHKRHQIRHLCDLSCLVAKQEKESNLSRYSGCA